MVKKAPESKASKVAKIQKTSSKEKKKWTAGKTKDVVKRNVAIDSELLAKVQKDVSNINVVTKAMVAERYNLNVGLSQKLLHFFCENGILALLSSTSKVKIYGKIKKEKKVEEKAPEAVEEVVA